MRAENSCNMWVFREGRNTIAGASVRAGLQAALRALSSPTTEKLVAALLRAGELEVALADAAAKDARAVAAITDSVAAALVGLPGYECGLDGLAAQVERAEIPDALDISTAEGFAYYALHPLDFADLVERMPRRGNDAAVIGIRSIGAPLSAVVSAALARQGLRSERITVRPKGHPFDRRVEFTAGQLGWIAQRRAGQAEFYVADEGPGISGSSFLSVGDALLQAGVERQRITFLCSRVPDPEALTAPEGPARWRAYRWTAVRPTGHVPEEAKIYCGGGEWRALLYSDPAHWPASWTQMERLKFLSRDRRRLFKFAGLGRFGEEVAEREQKIAQAGFGLSSQGQVLGFSELPWVAGRTARAADLNAAVLERIADYCAFRGREFRAEAPGAPLKQMVRFNVAEEFAVELDGSLGVLADDPAVITDSRMQPHEWLVRPEGPLLKTDCATHGDDHFFPGPVSVAWDLAGAIVEWGMQAPAADYLLARYEWRSGETVRRRMPAYLLAYTVFRMAYCAMAAFVMRGSPEQPRLHDAYQRYRAAAERQLPSHRQRSAQGSIAA